MVDNKKKKRKLQTKKTGVGDPTIRLIFKLEDWDDATLVENVPLSIKVDIEGYPQPIISQPSLILPTIEPIMLMAGFTGSIGSPNENDTLSLKTTITALPNEDYDLILENDTGLESTVNIEQHNIVYDEVTFLSGEGVSIPNSSEVVFQSREQEGNPSGDDGIYVFLAHDNSSPNNNVITDCYFVSNQLDYLWIVEKTSNNTFTFFNRGSQQYLGYDGNLVWLPSGSTGSEIEWIIKSETGSSFPYSIQSVKATNENAISTYLKAVPTTIGGDVKLAQYPSPWYLHIDIVT